MVSVNLIYLFTISYCQILPLRYFCILFVSSSFTMCDIRACVPLYGHVFHLKIDRNLCSVHDAQGCVQPDRLFRMSRINNFDQSL